MMDINEFSRAVRNILVARYPLIFPEYRASIELVEKNNGVVLHGLTVIPDKDGATPVVYLEAEYERYLLGEDLDQLCDEVKDRYREATKDLDKEMGNFLDKDYMKKSLRVDLVDNASNQDLLRKLVSRDVGCGYSFTAFVDLPEESPIDGRIRLTKDQAKSLELTEEQLMDKAIRCSQRIAPAVLGHPGDIASFGPSSSDVNILDTPEDHPEGFLVLTTSDSYMGAAALFYPGIQEKIARAIGNQDYYVLPSSVHEVIIIPDTGELSAMALAGMVFDVNMKLVDREERLGNRVLRYSRDTKELSVAADLDKNRSMDMER
ncbi:MAG: DUF5688 family protein [Oscillospiraceae bacterium]|nr:DUF5688 family protein [Oscillospiraceae bacterium]